MYTNPKLFKISSIILLIFDCLSAMTLAYTVFAIPSALKLSELSLFFPKAAGIITVAICTILSIAVIAVLFFAYMRFTSTYTFGNMIMREQRGDTSPFKARGFFGMPASGYQKFGNVIFLIELISFLLSGIIMIIAKSIDTNCFISIPVIPIAIFGLHLFLTYITYYVRYKSFGDVLSIANNKTSEITAKQAENLKNTKTSILRGYCVFMFVICVINIILTIALIILGLYFFPSFGWGGAFLAVSYVSSLIFACAVNTLSFISEGCFFDNLSRMSERLMIKHGLIDNENYKN